MEHRGESFSYRFCHLYWAFYLSRQNASLENDALRLIAGRLTEGSLEVPVSVSDRTVVEVASQADRVGPAEEE